MSDAPRRPAVKIRFKYNVDTGEIEQFLVDDQAPDRSEHYHDKVAEAVAGHLGRRPRIEDAGPRHLLIEEAAEKVPSEVTPRPEDTTDREIQSDES
ncbi:MAG: hypothetical protein GY856_38925 [bacterium]|nr:hypothetical protein [bacterium]